MGICIEPPKYVIGLEAFEQYIYRTQPEGERSGPGDIDLCVYSLRKYMRLLLNGNPSIQHLLFAPASDILEMDSDTWIAGELLLNKDKLISKRCIDAYLGYMQQQRERLEGNRGRKGVNRPELIEKYGFDTKYAYHLLRLGIQGVQLLNLGHVVIPVLPEDATFLRSVRLGEVPKEDCIKMSLELEDTVKKLRETSVAILDVPDREWANNFLRRSYIKMWKHHYYI